MRDYNEWLVFDALHPAPTFFARPAFARSVAEVYPHLEPRLVETRAKGKTFFVPGCVGNARGGLSIFAAMPFGGYSVVVDEGGGLADEAAAGEVIARLARRFDRFSFTAWPLGPQPRTGAATAHARVSAAIDCSAGREAALAGMRGVTRRMAGQAARRGVVCERVEPTPAAIDEYYELLREASEGWGLAEPTIPRAMLGAVFRHAGVNAELWFARVDAETIAGGVVLFGAAELFFWSAAMRRSHAQLRPSNALNVRLIERACERGVRWYNLGASEGLTGVERFKHDLGASDAPYATYESTSVRFSMLRRVRTLLGHRRAS